MVNVRKAAYGILMIVILTVAIAGSGMASGPPVFINEIHYDNTGVDTGEAIEVAGPAGTDLTGWSIVTYGGDKLYYGSHSLSGTIPDQQSGYGTLWFSVPGLQNGAPDGLALVDPSGAAVQLLSYEGSFTALDGPAGGMTSADIGVSEAGGTPVGYSLQLVGSGTMAGDFTWASEQPNTFGSINTGQMFGSVTGLNPGDLVINEIMQDPAIVSDSVGEWFEVYNNTAGSVDLAGLTVSDDDSDSFIIETSVVVAPGGFAVLGNNESSGINGGVVVDYQYFSFFLDNGADEVVIFDGAIEIDRVNYDGGPNFPYPNGAAMALNDTASDNNVGANWCTSSTEFGFGDLGTPGAANDCLTHPELSNIAITDVNENGVAVLTGNAADAGMQDSLTLAVDWGDGSPVSTYIYPAGTAAFTETHQYLDDNPSGTASDPYTVGLTLTDDGTGADVDSITVLVANLNPTLSNVAITDVNENGVAVLTGNAADVGTQDSLTLAVDWGDGSPVSTYSYPAGTAVFTETHQYLDDSPSGTASDPYTVGLTLTDDDTGTDVDSVTVIVANLNPTLSNVAITDVNENGVAVLTGNAADVGTQDSSTLVVDWGDGSPVSTYSYPAGTAAFTETHRYLDDKPSGTFSDPYTVSLILTDDDTGSDTDSTLVTVTNVNPVLSADVSTQDVQYSDLMANITITGTDVAGDPLLASTSWNVNGGAFAGGLPAGMGLTTNSCSVDDNLRTCTWTLSGIADVPAGTYLLRITVDDDDLGQSSILRTMTVMPEDSFVSFDGDNPVAVQVTEPESNASLPFEMVVYIEELEPDQAVYGAAPGEIALAEVSMTLQPVGPGSPVTVACTPVLIDATDNYDDVLQATCAFADVPVNTYSTNVLVDGGYYDGYSEDVLVVYDPSLGFTTGGGWFYWPGSEDAASGYPGDKTNFGYSMSYNQKNLKNVKGSLLLIRHLADGTKYRVKSNALEGLSLADAGLFGWASFSGKNTYMAPEPEFWDAALGEYVPKGNYTFLVYVEDHDEPGNGIDEFWIEVREPDNKGGAVVEASSLARPGSANAELIQGGNIVVPHSGIDDGNQPPAAGFSYTTSGLKITFTDASGDTDGNIISWDWDFGDGNSSTAQDPSYTYAAGGSYNVTLTVTDNEGASDSASQEVTVSGANLPPVAEFSFSATGLAVNFSDLSDDADGTVDAWSWDFGDGATSNSQDPSHTFPASGTYDVLLTVTDNDGASDTFGQQVTVSDGSGGAVMYIADLTGTSTPDGGGAWNAMVTITVRDESGDPVVNATVSGSWSKGFYASSNCTTDAGGQCTVEQTGIDNKTRRVTFTIDDVTHSALTYDQDWNALSSIRVDRP